MLSLLGEDQDDNADYTADLQVGDGDGEVPRPEEERETLAAKNQRLQKQLEVRFILEGKIVFQFEK